MSSKTQQSRRIALAAGVVLALAAGLAGCGKQGPLERPAPLFGAKARAEYDAMKAQEARDEAQRRAQRGDAPPPPVPAATTRDVLDPNQRNTPASAAPAPGSPNPFGNRTPTLP